MKLRKLASLVIAGAMLVSALPMTANADTTNAKIRINSANMRANWTSADAFSTYTSDYWLDPWQNNGTTLYAEKVDGLFTGNYSNTKGTGGETYNPETYVKVAESGTNYEGAWGIKFVDDVTIINPATPALAGEYGVQLYGADTTVLINDGKTVTIEGPTDSYGSMALEFKDWYGGTTTGGSKPEGNDGTSDLEKATIKGGTLIARAGSKTALVNWATDPVELSLFAGIATVSTANNRNPGVSVANRAVSLVIDGSDVTADGGNVKLSVVGPPATENAADGNLTRYYTTAYGIYNPAGTITLQNDATLTAMGYDAAVYTTSIVPADATTRKVQGLASTNYDGSNPVVVEDFSAVDAATLATYKWIDVEEVDINAAAPTLPSEPEDTNVAMTVAGTSAVVDGKKNVGFTATVAAGTYNSVLMQYAGAVYGWGLDTAITLADQAEVGIQVNNVPEAATIAVKLSSAVLN